MRVIKNIKHMGIFSFRSIKIQVYKSRYIETIPLASFLYFFYSGADLNPFSWDNRSLLCGTIVQKQHLVASHTWTRQLSFIFLLHTTNFSFSFLFILSFSPLQTYDCFFSLSIKGPSDQIRSRAKNDTNCPASQVKRRPSAARLLPAPTQMALCLRLACYDF